MKFLSWDDGRQLSGYSKMLLAISERFKFDVYLIRIPDGCGVPKHRDPAKEGFDHHRVNIAINKPSLGTGNMHIAGPAKKFLFDRIIYFRPDLYVHSMDPVDFIWSDHSAYILSIGWLRKSKK